MAKKKPDLTDEDARSTPFGLFNFAESYWLSAKALKAIPVKGATHRDFPIFFLYYHAIELYLKAYLRLYHSMRELRSGRFSHDAGALSRRARELGLPIKPKERTLFSFMSETDAVIRSRYLASGAYRLPQFSALERTCKSLREPIGWAIVEGTGVALRGLHPRRRQQRTAAKRPSPKTRTRPGE